METRKATTAIFIDKYHPKGGSQIQFSSPDEKAAWLKNNGKCAISIRVTYDRKKKYYPTPFELTADDFEKALGSKPRGELKEIALKLQMYEQRAAEVIKTLPFFTWTGFESLYLLNKGTRDSVSDAFNEYVDELKEEGRVGTAVSYQCAQSSLQKFQSKLKFAEVTPEFLRRYEKWMLNEGNSFTTIGIYLRSLRSLFNRSSISKEIYPFGKKKYEIPTGRNIKKALSTNDISKIYYHIPSATNAQMAKDYWFFMYLCNGINVKDFCHLKYENIKGDNLEFLRAKTIRTKRQIEKITVPLVEDAKIVIEKWGNQSKEPEDFIFPILKPGLTPSKERDLIQLITKLINKHLKAIAEELKIEASVTTYVARHSFATILQRSGANVSYISQALGHGSIRTTQNYLGGFEDEAKKETAKALTAFKNLNLKAV